MLAKDVLSPFIEREKRQGKVLRNSLKGRYQKTFEDPKPELRRLRARKRSLLTGYHDYGRIRWMRGLGGYLCEHLGAEAPDWVPDQPVYFLTVIDQEQVHRVHDWPWSLQDQRPHTKKPAEPPRKPGFHDVLVRRGPDFDAVRESYSCLLPRDSNYVG